MEAPLTTKNLQMLRARQTTKEAWATPLTPRQSSWSSLLAEFKALQESEFTSRANRDRWMQMAEACVNTELAYMQSTAEALVACQTSLQSTTEVLFARQPCLRGPPSKKLEPYSTTQSGFFQPPSAVPTKCEVPSTYVWPLHENDFDFENQSTTSVSLSRLQTKGGTTCESTACGDSFIVQSPGRITPGEDEMETANVPVRADNMRVDLMLKHMWRGLEDPEYRWWAKWFHLFYALIVVLSVSATITATLKDVEAWLMKLVMDVDYGFNALFTVEVVVRLVSAPSLRANFKNVYFWMDVGAVIPFYIRVISGLSPDENAFIELIYVLIPILRLLKIARFSNGWRLLLIAMKRCFNPLLVPLFFLTLLTIFFSCVIFWIEKHSACKPDPEYEDPDEDLFCPKGARQAFGSIPHTMWYSLATMSTVGYGDVTPNTIPAKIASAFLILIGVCYLSMPLTIVGSSFSSVWDNRDVILIQEKTKERFQNLTVEEVRRVFKLADEDGSGTVTRDEFIELCMKLDVGMSPADIAKMYKSMDDDGSGAIAFEEFLLFLFPEVAAKAEEEQLMMKKSKSCDKVA